MENESRVTAYIKEAIQHDERIAVYYQPIYDTRSGSFTSAEALVRMYDRDGKMIPPGDFIPVAEANGMILQIGEIVFDKVCRFFVENNLTVRGMSYIEVNLSMVQCVQSDLADTYIGIMEKHHISAANINLEITESATMEEKQLLLQNMKMLIELVQNDKKRRGAMRVWLYGVSFLKKEYRPMHMLYPVFVFLCMALCFWVLAVSFFRQKRISYKVILSLFIAQMFSVGVYVGERMLHSETEWMVFVYLMDEILILVLIRRIGMYEVADHIANALKEHSTYGFLVFDRKHNYLGCNEKVQEYLPEVSELRVDHKIGKENAVQEKTEHISKMQDQILLGVADMIESRDSSTGGHVKRTSEVVRIFTAELEKSEIQYGFSKDFLAYVMKAVPMHDLGKITVDDRILRKPGKFTQEEFEEMKNHADRGGEIVARVLCGVEDEKFIQIAENMAHYHHERWDGSGVH